MSPGSGLMMDYDETYEKYQDDLKYCTNTEYEDAAVFGYGKFAAALIDHGSASGDWRKEINRAITALSRCQIDFYNTDIAAQCETYEEKAIKYKLNWST
jgi:hypothetical protein